MFDVINHAKFYLNQIRGFDSVGMEGRFFGFPIGKRSCRWHMAWTTVQSVICRTMAIVAIRTINERTVLLTPQTGQFSATDEKRKTAGLAEW